jgi:hypothetical protein
MFKPTHFTESFPRFTEAVDPEALANVPPILSLHLDQVLNMAAMGLQAAQVHNQQADEVFAVSQAAIEDLNVLHRAIGNDPYEDRALRFLRFVVGQAPLAMAMALGLKGKAFDWLYQCVSIDHSPAAKYNIGYSYLPLPYEGDPTICWLALEEIPKWISALYVIARTTTGVTEMADKFFETCWEVAWNLANQRPEDDQKILALAAMASWASYVDHPETESITASILALWIEPRVSPWAKTVLGQVFCTSADRFTERTAPEWADLILRDFAAHLEEHQRLQLMCVAIRTRADWETLRPKLLAEVSKLAALNKAEAIKVGVPWRITLEARVEVISPLVHTLTRLQHLDGLLDLLAVWYGQPGATRCGDDVMFVHSTFESGTAYLWRDGMVVATDDAPNDGSVNRRQQRLRRGKIG